MANSKVVFLSHYREPVRTWSHEKPPSGVMTRLKAPFIRSIRRLGRCLKTIPRLSDSVTKLYLEGKHAEALELSTLGLTKCKTNNERHNFWWWHFMGYAVYCADRLKHDKILNRLLSISEGCRRSYEGSHAAYAYCYCRFSRLAYEQEQYDSALRFAELARKADDGSAEAHYLLGYYELFINENDPTPHFNAAIERDPKMLRRIARHPFLNEYPGIINELLELRVV